jgi:Icc-related predicted phosphoesterase
MKVTAVSDLHGDRPKLVGGDLLIIGGDLTARDRPQEYVLFNEWIDALDYKKKIVICGNHDMWIAKGSSFLRPSGCTYEYLCDSGTEYQGLKIWGTPWTQWFHGVNPDCTAFMLRSEFDLIEKYALIPYDTDILISHGPCYMRLDKTIYGDYAGSQALRDQVEYLKEKRLQYHFHGHIHEAYGEHKEGNLWTFNVSRMNRDYRPVNKILNIEI